MKISEFFWLAAFHRTELRSAITYKFLHVRVTRLWSRSAG
jgi:hypothetical protein